MTASLARYVNSRPMIVRLGFVPLILVSLAGSASALEISAKSGAAADIQAAVTTVAAAGGGTVHVPAGTVANFSGSITIPSGVTVMGAPLGPTSTPKDPEPTTILETSGSEVFLLESGSRLSQIALTHTTTGGGDGIRVKNAEGFRIDHCKITGWGDQADVRVDGVDAWGVVDHSYLQCIPGKPGTNYGVVVYKSATWWPNEADPQNFWTKARQAKAVYMEDNHFADCRHASASNSGAYYVFRYNWVTGGNPNTSSRVDMHGYEYGGTGGRYVEVYKNVIDSPAPYGNSYAICPRGGDGVIFDNTVNGYGWAVMYKVAEGQTGPYPLLHQVRDLYVWNNGGSLSAGEVRYYDSTGDSYIKEGRDWYHKAKPDYSPYTYPHPLVSGTDPTDPTDAGAPPDLPGSSVADAEPDPNPDAVTSTGDRVDRVDGSPPDGCSCALEAGSSLEAPSSLGLLGLLLLLRRRSSARS
jgi:hypothetical protein